MNWPKPLVAAVAVTVKATTNVAATVSAIARAMAAALTAAAKAKAPAISRLAMVPLLAVVMARVVVMGINVGVVAAINGRSGHALLQRARLVVSPLTAVNAAYAAGPKTNRVAI